MKILVSDPIHEEGIKLLKEVADVEVATDLEKEELLDKIKNADGLLVRSATKVTGEVINHAKNLKVIGRAGVGVD
ncbi:MAG: phosphoglycerate dehydrogenase, partial [Candidatus Hydrothermarchaeales archaeon]